MANMCGRLDGFHRQAEAKGAQEYQTAEVGQHIDPRPPKGVVDALWLPAQLGEKETRGKGNATEIIYHKGQPNT